VPSYEWVLDTWLLETSQDPQNAASLDALALLQEIKSRHRIAVDHGRKILHEYLAHAPGSSHAGQWIKVTLATAGKIVWRTGNVPARNRRHLLKRLHFDPSDLVFVGVAAEGPDRIIVSEDSDYTDDVKAYLADQMRIRVLSVTEALALARDP